MKTIKIINEKYNINFKDLYIKILRRKKFKIQNSNLYKIIKLKNIKNCQK